MHAGSCENLGGCGDTALLGEADSLRHSADTDALQEGAMHIGMHAWSVAYQTRFSVSWDKNFAGSRVNYL